MILIALGSNMAGPWGSPYETLLRAMEQLNTGSVRLIRTSTIMSTAPFGKINQPDFKNAVVEVSTHLPPDALMRKLHAIEYKAGRRRGMRWGPRTLDLDLVDYHGLVRKQKGRAQKALVLPHPGIEERSFVAGPIAEIAPNWRHPISRKSAKVIIQKLYGLNRD